MFDEQSSDNDADIEDVARPLRGKNATKLPPTHISTHATSYAQQATRGRDRKRQARKPNVRKGKKKRIVATRYARLGVSPPRGGRKHATTTNATRELSKKRRSLERAALRREKNGGGGGTADDAFDDVKSEGEGEYEETNAKLRDAKRTQMLNKRLDKLKTLPKHSKYAKSQIELVNKCLEMLKVTLRSLSEEDEITRLMHSVSLELC